ncbi:hypothetical protein [Agrobacterium vitis]|uniref:hypothetical protein n=1 Tax=Agrobacterium vitis TaxID=373 RepID=UPI00157197CD|nr:hypothetical protein [Agrobacterium vitis]NSZ15298.1 hypothetical protein [Agrobacterium vitis]QZO04170.1 hypothetical protein K4831_00870 [Agrobacterium vitis]UJL89298.1 hypothetical protein AVF2S5_16090 [Agrobacterium vitis]
MARLRTVYLTPDDIKVIVNPLMAEGFSAYGFRSSTIEEDETFSGDPIIRIRADVTRAVPANETVSVLSKIHAALREKNDERTVFLSAPGPSLSDVGDDEDEDSL